MTIAIWTLIALAITLEAAQLLLTKRQVTVMWIVAALTVLGIGLTI